MVNDKLDASSSENNESYTREIYDANVLYEAFIRAKKGSDWKPHVQKFEMFYLLELANIQDDLINKTYKFHPCSEFIINERGHIRVIKGEQIPDRIVKHALCDEVLNPKVNTHLIFDNGASQVGKGISFTRRRLEYHLRRYYREHHTNEGYILLLDFKKYYDNIRHDRLMEVMNRYVKNDTALWLLEEIVARSRVDVSYMTDEEYEKNLNGVFSSLEHELKPKALLSGQRFLPKHMNIGDQVSQTAGIAYPIDFDNFLKIVKGLTYCARYMDDSYVIAQTKEELKELLTELEQRSHDYGIIVNMQKTHIAKLSDKWRFLQIHYTLTETGKIIRKVNPKRVTCMRRRIKKVACKMTTKEFTNWYNAWFMNFYRIMSKQQRENLNNLFNKFKEECKDVQNQT